MQDVSKILTRKYYGKKDPFRSREFRQPRWMELLAVLLFTVSGLGEGKSINVVLGGLPKAVTLAFVGLAGLEFFIRGDFDRLKKLAGPSGLYILYLAVLAAWSMFIWVRNFTAFASITRGVEKILYQSIATVVAICCVYLYGRFSIDLFTIGICCANLFILFSEVPAYGVGESVSSLLTSILIGWIVGPKWICDEVQKNGEAFPRAGLYSVLVRYVVPVVMLILFLVSTGLWKLNF